MSVSALRPRPLSEGTIRGSDGVAIAREMMADKDVGWERIPDDDRIAFVQAVMGICCGAERSGWRFTRPATRIILPYTKFLIATGDQCREILKHAPDVDSLTYYERKMVPAVINPVLAAMSRLGWTIVAPQERKPIHEGGFRNGRLS